MFDKRHFGAKGLKDAIRRQVLSFAKEEDGALIIFGLIIFVMMLMAGGMAVDFMRFEHDRARIQYTLDRSILAAGSLSQEIPADVVVRDYFDKSDVKNFDLQIAPTSGTNFKIVDASATTTMNTYFVNMLGIDTMKASASGVAVERKQKVEISLVLDVSGSMGRNNKLENLKVAAKEFVDTVLTSDSRDLISISIVPYNMQVHAGADIMSKMQVTEEHAYSHCVDFKDNQFDSTALDLQGTTYQRTGHFDPFYRNSTDHPNTNYDDFFRRYFMCPTTDWSKIQLFSQDNEALKAKIDSLKAGGNTSIDVGVRWGAAFLDPSTQPIVAATANVPAVFHERPIAYSSDEIVKVLVVMTDGVNTTQYTLDDRFKDGPSNIWFDPDSTWMGIQMNEGVGPDLDGSGHADDAVFFNSDLYEFDLDGDGIDDKYVSSDPHNAANARRLTWPEVWNLMSTRYNAYYNHYAQNWDAAQLNKWRNDVVNGVGRGTKDARLDRACTAAKNNGVAVYTIGFEVTDSSAQVMRRCANSEANYFGVAGDGISDAFNQIAKMIQRLKLVN